jgi:hypothetical protein
VEIGRTYGDHYVWNQSLPVRGPMAESSGLFDLFMYFS